MILLDGIAIVLDTSAIIRGFEFLNDDALRKTVGAEKIFLFTTESVVRELRYERSKMHLNLLLSRITVLEPRRKYLDLAKRGTSDTGLSGELSNTDLDVLALALELKGRYSQVYIATDDIKLQNVCVSLGIGVVAFRKKLKYLIYRRKKCAFCGVEFEDKYDECPNCGSRKFYYVKKKIRVR